MNILDKIEKRFPFIGFNSLNVYMVVILLVGLIIDMVNPYFYYYSLSLNIEKILNGQIYRLFTFVFYPPTKGIFALLMVYVYYSITKTLVMIWGNAKFNIYIFIGYVSQILGAFFIYFIAGKNVVFYPTYTTFSIIMAFALSFPSAYFYIYFMVPIKAKYFAYFEIAIYALSFLFSGLNDRVAIVCSAINVFVFFVLLKNKIN